MTHQRSGAGRIRSWLLLAATLVLATGATLGSASTATATFPGGNGSILFTRGGNLYTASSAGDAVTQLTTSGGVAGPKWSPDGGSIAYRRGSTIYVRTYPGGVTTSVATGATGDPQWSPDGSTIAFVAAAPTTPCNEQAVYTVAASGGIPALAFDPHSDNCPHGEDALALGTYVPDGRALLTTCYVYGNFGRCGISLITLSGTDESTSVLGISCDLEEVDPAEEPPCSPGLHLSNARIGPAGRLVLFSGKGGYDGPIGVLPGSTPLPAGTTAERPYVVDISGNNLHSISAAVAGHSPTRSPSGDTVLFSQNTGTGSNLMRSTVSAESPATVFLSNASRADWQPVP